MNSNGKMAQNTDPSDNLREPPQEGSASPQSAASGSDAASPPSAGANMEHEDSDVENQGASTGDAANNEAQQQETERGKLKDQLLRMAADFDNFRKRSRRDIDDAAKRAREDILREVLPLVDNLERAVDAASSATEIEAVAEGVRMVLKGFEETASRIGLERVAAVGERFDPNVHDAVQQMETTDHPVGTIVSEVVPGYRFGGKLLRAAMVVVAKAPPSEG